MCNSIALPACPDWLCCSARSPREAQHPSSPLVQRLTPPLRALLILQNAHRAPSECLLASCPQVCRRPKRWPTRDCTRIFVSTDRNVGERTEVIVVTCCCEGDDLTRGMGTPLECLCLHTQPTDRASFLHAVAGRSAASATGLALARRMPVGDGVSDE